MSEDAGDASLLRAKYLDWCSAQIADRFLRLPPAEIYELAHEVSRDEAGRVDPDALTILSLLGITIEVPPEGAAELAERLGGAGSGRSAARDVDVVGERTETGGGAAAGGGGGRGSYRRLVAQVAERLAVRMDLPSFEEWSAAYRADPERYDRQMLGFWRDAEAGAGEGGGGEGE